MINDDEYDQIDDLIPDNNQQPNEFLQQEIDVGTDDNFPGTDEQESLHQKFNHMGLMVISKGMNINCRLQIS